jgi:ABC-type transport system involved in cytochrome c biogenesis permease subunit
MSRSPIHRLRALWPSRSLALVRSLALTLAVAGVVCFGADAPSATAGTAAAPAAPSAAAPSAHHAHEVLRPIAESLAGLDLRALEAVPIQHGGRYKPMHALAMEVIDGLGGSSTLGPRFTPVASLLDLIFCNAAYLDQPIVTIKHSELCHDLAQSVPAEDRETLRTGHISPRLLDDEAVQAAIETLSRQTSKTKAINQVRRAHSVLDVRNLVSQLHLLALPGGAHSDRWRDPNEASGEFNDALAGFLGLAVSDVALGGSLGMSSSDRFAQLTWNPLPLTVESAVRLGLANEDLQRLNHDVLWPLWQAASTGSLKGIAASDIPGLIAHAGFSVAQATQVTEGLHQLAAIWPRLGVADEDVARPSERAALSLALGRASAAWTSLGSAWSALRQGAGNQASVQTQVDALVASSKEIIALCDQDRAARNLGALRLDTDLELTYWRLNGFSGVAWLFLAAVPLLALGSIGRVRLPLRIGYLLFALGLGGQIAAFIIRGILAQRIPLANLYESMAAASLLCSLVALIGECSLWWRSRAATLEHRVADQATAASAPPLALTLTSISSAPRPDLGGARGSLALGASLFGCIVVTAQVFLEYHDINAFISPQMPILSEFWLRVHTSCVVSSYGLISLGGLMSLTYLGMRLALPWNDSRCVAWDRTTFAINAIATVVLWVGLCLGAVWAAQSWGRPWGWDPKEVFALLTWVVFVMLVHLRLAVSPARRGLATAIVSVSAFVVMAFNWYVVNVVLAGLHSYA